MPPEVPAQPEPQKESLAEWYYVTGEGRKGPVTLESLHQYTAAGLLGSDALVWKAGMPDWIALSRHQEGAQEPPLPEAPPPPERPAPRWSFWVLVLAPVWGALLQIVATEVWVALTHKQLSYYSQLWWIIVLANLGAAALDFLALKKSGQDVASLGKGMYLLVPMYIYRRERRSHAQSLRCGVWAGSLLLSVSACLYLNDLYARLLTR